jgi:hypothetical protein
MVEIKEDLRKRYLGFIKPMGYPQKISFTRCADGSVKNVQIRVVAGSQQNIKLD